MSDLYYYSVFVHILCAIIWIGGMIFMAIVLIPSIKNHPDKAFLIHSVGLKFRTVGWITLFILLVTGLYNMHMRNIDFTLENLTSEGPGRKILYKFIIFLLTVIISLIHDFYIGIKATKLWMNNTDENRIKNYRGWARWAGRINLIIALTAAGIGIALVRGF